MFVLQEGDEVDGVAKRGMLARLAEEEVEPRAPVLQELGVERRGGDDLVRKRVEDDAWEGCAELVAEPCEVGEPSLDAEPREPEHGHVGVDGDDVRGVRGHAVADLDGLGDARDEPRAGRLLGGRRVRVSSSERGRGIGIFGYSRGGLRIAQHDALVGRGRGRRGGCRLLLDVSFRLRLDVAHVLVGIHLGAAPCGL